MNEKQCPRCNEVWPLDHYQPPLTICLVCYGRHRGNRGLNIYQLREKANKSWYARARKNKDDARSFERALFNYTHANVDYSVLDPMECDLCHQESTQYDFKSVRGEPSVVCFGCIKKGI